MSVIVKEQEKFKVFIKGSPEKIKSLCIRDSLPSNFDDIYNEFSIQGLRVLALAYRDLRLLEDFGQKKLGDINRVDVDRELQFLGFLVLENPLKPDSLEIITRIKESELP